jgi:hypothetical protein
MNIKINLRNIEINSKNIQKLKKNINIGVKEGLRSAGKYITDEIKREMDLPKTGRTYNFYRSKNSRRSSSFSGGNASSFNKSISRTRISTYPAPKGLKIASGSFYTHVASNDSGRESSAVLTGKLKQSVYNVSKGSNQQEIGAKAKHAGIQEFGSGNVVARKNFQRPISQNKTQMANRIRNSINNKINEIK